MNKSALKSFATSARRELLERVELQARKIGITSEAIQKAQLESSDAIFINGKQLSEKERVQRNKLIARIRDIGFDRVMEEVAYTWFNRFTALRFMEVNDYLPTKVRVLSSINAESAEPDMMKEALSLDLNLDKEYVYELKMDNNNEELFKYLIIKHCNDLNQYMPFMFETIDDYTEILFPSGLLGADSFIGYMINQEIISEENWKSVEIIGWLYQFYISEEKDKVFSNLKKNIKVTKDTLPAATQLFTPNWIVRYMVENSLGRIWTESNPQTSLKSHWKYYLDENEQESEVIKQLEEVRFKDINPEDITFFDPCCGSGHILVYAFDVFYEMYLEKGYMENEIPKLILEKNLYGIDIDDRAVQLASFAVMMKAREKSRKILKSKVQLNICAIQESDWLSEEMISNFSNNVSTIEAINQMKDTFLNAKEYGSILHVELTDYDMLTKRFFEYKEEPTDLIELIDKQIMVDKFPLLLKQSSILSKKYDVVCTNPPYMGYGNMSEELKNYVQKYHSNTKSDLYAVFIEVGKNLTKENGYSSFVTMHSWFFLNSFENFREELIKNNTITSILHLGMEAFDGIIGKVVQTAAFVLKKHSIEDYKPFGIRVVDFYDSRKHEKSQQFFNKENWYLNTKQKDFLNIPGSPIVFWLSQKVRESFKKGTLLGEMSEPKTGLQTGDNNRFIRLWFEVDNKKIGFGINNLSQALDYKKKWFPFNKGGKYRKWFGNDEYIVNWENGGSEIINHKSSCVRNKEYYFQKGITWTKVTSFTFSTRYSETGFIFSDAGMKVFVEDSLLNYVGAFLNSNLVDLLLGAISETMNYEKGNIERLPLIITEDFELRTKIDQLYIENVNISKAEWDSYETSWNYSKHPFLMREQEDSLIRIAYKDWENTCQQRVDKLWENENVINETFLEIYSLSEEINPTVEKNQIALRSANEASDVKSFLSYFVGCSFGRYSLDEEGLIFAGGKFDSSRYKKFTVDEDNILPILSGSYFEDDIVTRFIEFIYETFGEDNLEENLIFVADAIGRKKNETAREALRRYFLNDFYKDHVQIYKKRPIYWLFTSGKEKAFNCLVYMHRYDKSTLSRIRTDYLHEVQIRMDAEKKDLLNLIEGDSTMKEISNAKKELKSLDKKIDELKAYDELLHHMADMQIEIDLDDGVAMNYAKFEGLVAKI